MRDRPAQRCDRRLPVDAFQHVEQMMNRAVVVPMERGGQPARRGPLKHAKEPLAIIFRGLFVVVHAPDDILADAVEAKVIVTEAHRHGLGHGLQVLAFVAAARRAQAVGDANRERAVAPDLEQRPVFRDRHVVAAWIEHTGDSEPVERPEESTGAGNLLLEARAWQQVIDVADGAVVAADPAGRLAVGAGFEAEPRYQAGLLGDAECLRPAGREQDRGIEHLHIDVVVRRGGGDLSLGRATAFGELPLGPAASDDQPGALRRVQPATRMRSTASASVRAPIQCTSVVKLSPARMAWM